MIGGTFIKMSFRYLNTTKRVCDQAIPPLTSNEAPVIYFDLSQAKNATASAMSMGSPKSPRGICERMPVLTKNESFQSTQNIKVHNSNSQWLHVQPPGDLNHSSSHVRSFPGSQESGYFG